MAFHEFSKIFNKQQPVVKSHMSFSTLKCERLRTARPNEIQKSNCVHYVIPIWYLNICIFALSNEYIKGIKWTAILTSYVAISLRFFCRYDPMIMLPYRENYKQIFELLIFNRQYEMCTRRLLTDVELLVHQSVNLQSEVKEVLDNIHDVCRFKSAVPVVTVFVSTVFNLCTQFLYLNRLSLYSGKRETSWEISLTSEELKRGFPTWHYWPIILPSNIWLVDLVLSRPLQTMQRLSTQIAIKL